MIRVRAVEPLHDYTVHITFTNNEQRDVDLTQYINTNPDGIFAPIYNDIDLFRQVYVDLGTIAWPNGADIDPDVLYLGLPPHASEEEWRAAVAAVQQAA